MKSLIFLCLFSQILISVTAQNTISDHFYDKSEKCFDQLHVPQRYKATFQAFRYPDEEIVHKYIHCVAMELEIWTNRSGFNIEKIYQQYRNRANDEVMLPTISNCNRSAQNSNKELWCYRAFLCILNTDVGKWFKEDVQRSRSVNNIPNGH
ncbi:general odorant-binding protein 99a-like [Musca autumnalis]|uniref:general odorant-binding protein 99a-like n=1 Tax=Musca autumnalis TaxID=221902 RepID=UPI003CE9FFB1